MPDLPDFTLEAPALAPHLDYRILEDNQLLLVSETFNTLLHGALYCALLPLLDGTRRLAQLAGALAGTHAEADVQGALRALARRGYVVAAGHGLARGAAAYWSAQGVAPDQARARMQAARVQVLGDDGTLAERLTALGVALVEVRPELVVRVCDDYLDEEFAGINRTQLASGVAWCLVRPRGLQPLFGPVFRPAQQGPCWRCLSYRLRGHQEVHNFLRNRGGDAEAWRPVAAAPGLPEALLTLAAAEIARWLVFGEQALLHAHAVSLDLTQLRTDRHAVQRRPQCFDCGDDALYRADRPAQPLQLKASPKRVHNSGGVRAVTPEATLARYRHLISPVSGVVTQLQRTTPEADPWFNVYWAGSNFSLQNRQLNALRRSLRNKSVGKGSTPQQSEASAVCEAIERYCCAFHEEEVRTRRSYADFLSAGEEEAILPNDVQLFSEQQLDNATSINARSHPYNIVPARLDAQTQTSWSPVWSFTQQRHRYLPTAVLYSMAADHPENPGLIADSNGCAAGNTLEEAILQGFYELVERDTFAVWWYNRLSMPGVDLGSFDDPYLATAQEYYGEYGRELWMLDLTHDLGIPVFIAISRRTDKEEEDILYGIGAHADPQIAALRAVCEINQSLNLIQGTGKGGAGHELNDSWSLWWCKNVKLVDNPYLTPAPDVALRTRSDYVVPDTTDVRTDVEHCRALVESLGLEFLALDLTRPDIGLPVARVIVPGLRHFWERLAPGRLYDVPVQLGWRDHPITAAEVNEVPVLA